MKKSTKYIILGIALVIILMILGFFMVYRPSIGGRVINAVTKEPLGEIKVHRIIQLESCFFECFDYVATSPSTKTNKNGVFRFWPNIIFQLPLLGQGFSCEDVTVNLVDPLKPGYEIDNLNYYFRKIENIERAGEKYIQEIELVPVVDSVKECKSNEECIGENSFTLALKNKDENLCLNINLSSTSYLAELSSIESYSSGVPQGICAETVAILKEDCDACNVLKKYYEIKDCKYQCLSFLKASKEGRRKYLEEYLRGGSSVSCYHFTLDSIKRRVCLELLNKFFEQKTQIPAIVQPEQETLSKYRQIKSKTGSKYCETNKDCDIAFAPWCCSCPEAFNKDYADKINKLPSLCIDPEIDCSPCPYGIYYWYQPECVNNSCRIIQD